MEPINQIFYWCFLAGAGREKQLREDGMGGLTTSDQRGKHSDLNSSVQLLRSSKRKSAAFPSPVAVGLMGRSLALMRHQV